MYRNLKKLRKSANRSIFSLIVVTSVFGAIKMGESFSSPKGIELKTKQKYIMPIKELSGIHVRQNADKTTVHVVGDTEAVMAQMVLSDKGEEFSVQNFSQALKEKLFFCQTITSFGCNKINAFLTTDWEALSLDGIGQIFLLQEYSASIFVLSPDTKMVKSILSLDFEPLSQLTSSFNQGSLGEGILLLKNGHILVAKEANPPALVEFGPVGNKPLGVNPNTVLPTNDEFELTSSHIRMAPLKVWLGSDRGKCDFSDLSWTDRSLFILSQRCQRIFELPEGLQLSQQEVISQKQYRLPKKLKKPEALFVTKDDFFVGIDSKKKKKKNLYRLARPSKKEDQKISPD